MAEKKIRHIMIKPDDDGKGGHNIEVHYKPMQREGRHGIQESYMEPESKSFGADEGHEMLAHVANHLEIPEMEEEGDEDEPGTKGTKEEEGDRDENKGEKAERRLTKESAKRVREKVA